MSLPIFYIFNIFFCVLYIPADRRRYFFLLISKNQKISKSSCKDLKLAWDSESITVNFLPHFIFVKATLQTVQADLRSLQVCCCVQVQLGKSGRKNKSRDRPSEPRRVTSAGQKLNLTCKPGLWNKSPSSSEIMMEIKWDYCIYQISFLFCSVSFAHAHLQKAGQKSGNRFTWLSDQVSPADIQLEYADFS